MAVPGFQSRWTSYRASKGTLFWACAGCAVATMVVGFSWGGWVTGGTAEKMSGTAAAAARAELAAIVCVARFNDGPDKVAQLTALTASNAWNRDDMIDKAGWSTPPGIDKPVRGAAELCAKRLIEAKAAGVAG